MFFKVVTLTLVLLVQITYQGKLMRGGNVMYTFNRSNDSIGHEKTRKTRQFGYFNKLIDNYHRIEGHQKSHHKSFFSEVMNFIISTPDYGLKYTEDQPRRLDFLSFPGFHSLIEVRGPTRYRYVPNKLNEYPMALIHNLNNNLKSPHLITSEYFKLQPKETYQLDEVSYSREGFSNWKDSSESYKRSSDLDLLKNTEHSTPLLKLYERRQYITRPTSAFTAAKAEVTPTPTNLNAVSFSAPNFFLNFDLLPYKEVKTRNPEPESDEDEEGEKSEYLESY